MAKNQKSQDESPSTERESAPATEQEMEELRAKAAQAEADAKALEEALIKSETLRKQEAQAAATAAAVPPPTYAPPPPKLPRNMQVERSGNVSAQYSTRWPQIRGGTCEFCGVLDGNVPGQYQYKLCPHFRGMTARCTYCPENKDPDEVVYHANMNVATHPDNPNMIIMWCNATACSEAHLKRFSKATTF